MNSLELILKNNPNLINISASKKDGLSSLLKEVIILDLIKIYLFTNENNMIEVKDIQNKYFKSMLDYKEQIDSKLFEKYNKKKRKIKLRQLIINLTTSNAEHPTGLARRRELYSEKNIHSRFYRLSDEFILFLSRSKYSILNQFYLSKTYPFAENLKEILYTNIPFDCEICYANNSFGIFNPFLSLKESFMFSGICFDCLRKKIDSEKKHV